MPGPAKKLVPISIDTVDGLFYFYANNSKVFLTMDKAEVDALQTKLCTEHHNMSKFWKDLNPQTIAPYPSYQNIKFWTTELKNTGNEDRISDYEKLADEIKDAKRRIKHFNMYARTMQRIIRDAGENRKGTIERVKTMISNSAADRKHGKFEETEAKDEYALQDLALAILDQYPVSEIQILLEAGNGKSTMTQLPDQKLEKWKASVQGSMLLLDRTIQQLEEGRGLHGWEVDIPDLESEEYSHISLIRDSDMFSTKGLSVKQKEALIKQAEKELDSNSGHAY